MGLSNKPGAASGAKRQRRLTQEHVDALQLLFITADEARSAAEKREEAARAAAAAGVSWPDMAKALGVTKQSAHARYAIATSRRRPTSAVDTLF